MVMVDINNIRLLLAHHLRRCSIIILVAIVLVAMMVVVVMINITINIKKLCCNKAGNNSLSLSDLFLSKPT